MPERILDIIAEDEKKQHVADEVHPRAVKEGGGQGRQPFRQDGVLDRKAHLLEQHDGDEAERNRMGFGHVGLVDDAGLEDEMDRDIQRDQRPGHIGCPDAVEGIGVVKRNEHRWQL
jgi:hypothetical protein